ncbi:hypothetical protein ZIOFF_067796 [Zingiber officinale]|uniref:Uncharacterized protein n=1 Tax=Zingiber officinale TaxID=94328 RepID=A0A8J5BKL9_ZINOF|nr:hypothetical protein ZIOFF_067796 [Zingiber officinale]
MITTDQTSPSHARQGEIAARYGRSTPGSGRGRFPFEALWFSQASMASASALVCSLGHRLALCLFPPNLIPFHIFPPKGSGLDAVLELGGVLEGEAVELDLVLVGASALHLVVNIDPPKLPELCSMEREDVRRCISAVDITSLELGTFAFFAVAVAAMVEVDDYDRYVIMDQLPDPLLHVFDVVVSHLPFLRCFGDDSLYKSLRYPLRRRNHN